MLKFFIPAQDEGDREDDFEELGSRDRVVSKTAFGSTGEREKIKVEAQPEFERIPREQIEISGSLWEMEKLDTTSEKVGDVDSENPNEHVYHLESLRALLTTGTGFRSAVGGKSFHQALHRTMHGLKLTIHESPACGILPKWFSAGLYGEYT